MDNNVNINGIELTLNEDDMSDIEAIDEEYTEKLKESYKKSIERGYKLKIQEIDKNNRIDKESKPIDNITASKFFMLFILINCTVIEIFSMIVMIKFGDLSSLPSLIVAVVTESISYAIYCAKSYSSKKSEVNSILERDKFEFEKGQINYGIDAQGNPMEESIEENYEEPIG